MREDLKALLSKYWAKSDGTTIREHTDKLLENLKLLKETYAEDIERLIPEDIPKILKEKFWEILELACEYHDYGKLHKHFQNKVGNKEVKPPKDLREVKHNLLSPTFVDVKDELIKKLVRLLVLHHHPVENVSETLVKQVLEKEFGINGNTIVFLIKKEEKEYLEEDVSKKFNINLNSLLLYYRLLKGLLLKIDHASSSKEAGEVEEEPPEDTLKDIEGFFKSKSQNLNSLQVCVKDKRDKNLVVIAPTGSGKTEAGFIYLKKKGFFMLPYRVSANGIYERMSKIFKEKLGLLHSSALNYLLTKENNQEYDNDEVLFNYYTSKNLAKPLVVCTPDQLMHFVFKYKGFEKFYATSLYSRLVVDEIQAYEPITLAFLVKALSVIAEGGGKFLVMTATFPSFLKADFEKMGVEFLTINAQYKAYHNVCVLNDSLMSDFAIEKIKSFSETSKVLVIANTVRRAQELYHQLKDLGANPNLLHSRFILKDRTEKERRIEEFFNSSEKGLWITTQLAEVSLDLDADYLFTELSTADSLIQRMGRCNRKGKKPTDKPNVFIFTEDCSGIGSVYFKDLYENTKENLKDGLWTWEDKWQLMDNVYSEGSIGKGYKNKYKKAMDYIESLWETDALTPKSKAKAQELFRDINSATVIPEEFKEEVEPFFEEWKNTKTDLRKKVELMNKIMDYTFQLPLWVIKGSPRIFPKLDIFCVSGVYNNELGFSIDSNKDPEINVI